MNSDRFHVLSFLDLHVSASDAEHGLAVIHAEEQTAGKQKVCLGHRPAILTERLKGD